MGDRAIQAKRIGLGGQGIIGANRLEGEESSTKPRTEGEE